MEVAPQPFEEHSRFQRSLMFFYGKIFYLNIEPLFRNYGT